MIGLHRAAAPLLQQQHSVAEVRFASAQELVGGERAGKIKEEPFHKS